MSPFLRQLSNGSIAAMICIAALFAACSPVGGQTGQPSKLARTKAFPSAVGYGAAALGGRGGQIIAVTTLADHSAGSLRACLEASGARTCVFRIAGVFRFDGTPPVIRNPYLTIAGQTAPGGGVTLAHDGTPESRTPLLIKNTNDIVVRHIRVRNDLIGGQRESEDSITIENSTQVIIDHVSGSWARDEIINGYGNNDNITISNSIFAYGIPKHDKCALLGSDPKNAQKFSFIGNICAHNGDRNPDINFRPRSCVEIINNVFYNAQSEFAEIWETYGGTPVALVGNSFKSGPDTTANSVGIVRQTIGRTGTAAIYLQDNQFIGDFNHIDTSVAMARKTVPYCPLTLSPVSAAAAYDSVLATAGAWPRDTVDTTVVSDVRDGTGHIVHYPGSIDPIAEGTNYPDTDSDGMDDRWEATHGAKVGVFDAWADSNRDGVLNFDAYLDYLDRRLLR